MPPDGLSRKDLEDHEARIQAANDRVVSVLKDVAVQFNTIANQLMQLAKLNEDISSALIERVYKPLNDSLREHNNHVKELYTTQSEAVRKDLLHVLESGRKASESALAKIENEIVNVREKQAAMEKDRIKSRTTWLIVLGAITGLVGLAAAIIKLLSG